MCPAQVVDKRPLASQPQLEDATSSIVGRPTPASLDTTALLRKLATIGLPEERLTELFKLPNPPRDVLYQNAVAILETMRSSQISWKTYSSLLKAISKSGWNEALNLDWEGAFGKGSSETAPVLFNELIKIGGISSDTKGLKKYLAFLVENNKISIATKVQQLTRILELNQDDSKTPANPKALVLDSLIALGWRDEVKPLWDSYFNINRVASSSVMLKLIEGLATIKDVPDIILSNYLTRATPYFVGDQTVDQRIQYGLAAIKIFERKPWSEELEPAWRSILEGFPGRVVAEAIDSLSRSPMLSDERFGSLLSQAFNRRIRTSDLSYELIAPSLAKASLERGFTKHLDPVWQSLLGNRDSIVAAEAALSHESVGERRFDLHEPSALERVALVLSSVCSNPHDLERVVRLASNKRLEPLLRSLVLRETDQGVYSTDLIKETYERILARIAEEKNFTTPNTSRFRTWPTSSMRAPAVKVDPISALSSMAIIGDGPAAILLARLRRELGYEPQSTFIVSKSGVLGGIWRQENVINEGHNTFRTVNAFGNALESRDPRPGGDVPAFLEGIVEGGRLNGYVQKGGANKIDFDPVKGKYRILVEEAGETFELWADSVCICTGNRIPRPLENGPIKNNITSLSAQERLALPIVRWQRQFSETDYQKFHGTRPVLVGLGNSSLAVIGEFQKMRSQGIDVNPLILTHYSLRALLNPDKMVKSPHGDMEGPLSRGRHNLTKLSLDIQSHAKRFREALELGWIVPDVVEWDAYYNGDVNASNLGIKVLTRNSGMLDVKNVPRLFALIGYTNDPKIMKEMGCEVDEKTGLVDFDPMTGRVKAIFNHPGRMYVAGAAASRPNDRNGEVIPAMMDLIPRIAFTDIVSSQR